MFAYVTREKSDASLEVQIKTFWLNITSSIFIIENTTHAWINLSQ